MKTSATLACLASLATMSAGAAELMLHEQTITTDAAMQVVGAALAACRGESQKVSVTVVDHAGRIKAQVRDDGAAPHTLEHSFRKAYTALSYKMPSAQYGKRAKDSGGAIGPQLLPNITTAAGGMPIRIGAHLIGAVGVSGTPSSAGGGEHDEKCAQQGIVKALGE
jgi:uncharacterized protein GlcG (DUF336 family)